MKEGRKKTRSGHDENRLILVDHWVHYKDGCWKIYSQIYPSVNIAGRMLL